MSRTRHGALQWFVWASPLAFALYAPLALLAENISEVQPAAVARPVVASLLLGLAAIAASRLVVPDRDGATVLACALVIGFFTYGHLYQSLKELGSPLVMIARHRWLLPGFAVLLVALGLLLRRKIRVGARLAVGVATAGWILIVFPLASLVVDRIQAQEPGPVANEIAATTLAARRDSPDIYYIVLDGYGREDVLRSSYAFDNGPFLDALRQRGFVIADRARSNYSRTLLSLSSSLNMEYVDTLRGEERRHTDYAGFLQHNRVFDLFRSLGYSIVAFDSGFTPTEFKSADVYKEMPGNRRPDFARGEVTAFEGMLLETTMAKAALDFLPQALQAKAPWLIEREYDNHRARVRFTLSELSEVASSTGGNFVFAHVLAPHPPFVFGPNGEERSPAGAFTLEDECCRGVDYFEGYRDQVAYINRLLLQEIDEVLEATQGKAIIILQGDHGPAGRLEWARPSAAGIQERMAILNAYRLPGLEGRGPDPGITPVNTFRMIFDAYFGGRFGRLEDASYFSSAAESTLTRVDPTEPDD